MPQRHLCCLLVFSVVVSRAFAQNDRTPKPDSLSAYLEYVHSLNEGVQNPSIRGRVLVTLASSGVKALPDRAPAWCEELLRVAKTMPPEWDKTACGKNGPVACSALSADEARWAFEHLFEVADPYPGRDGSRAEDPRTDGANRFVIPRYIKAVGIVEALPRVRKMAETFRGTGQFPYEGYGALIKEAAANPLTQDQAEALFREALTDYQARYTDGSTLLHFGNDAVTFAHFLQAACDSVSESLCRTGIETLAANAYRYQEPKRFFTGTVVDDKGNVLYKVTSITDADLYRVFSLIQTKHPELAARVAAKNPLFAVKGKLTGGFVIDNRTPEEIALILKRRDEVTLVRPLRDAADVKQVDAVLPRLTFPELRADALAYRIRAIGRSTKDPKEIKATVARMKHARRALKTDMFNSKEFQQLWLDTIYTESLYWAAPDKFPGAVDTIVRHAFKRYRTEPRVKKGIVLVLSEYESYQVMQRMINFLLANKSEDRAWSIVRDLKDDDLKVTLLADSVNGFFPPPGK